MPSFCTQEAFVRDLFGMTTISSVHFLTRSTKLTTHKDRVQISIHVYSGKLQTITDLKEAIMEEMRAISRSVCKKVMDNFVMRLKKCTELNGGHLEQMLQSTQEQADRYHVLALCLEYKEQLCLNFHVI